MKQMKESVGQVFLWSAAAVIVGLMLCMSLLPFVGANPGVAMATVVQGVFTDPFTAGNILVKAAPLILTALAFAFTFKANLYNIGAQGQFYAGCICATAVSLSLDGSIPASFVIVFAALAAMGAGAAVGFVIGWLKARCNANEFLVSMMSTYVVIYVMKLLLRTVLQESKHEYVQSNSLDVSTWLPRFLPGTSASIGILISVVAAIAVWFLLRKSAVGFRIRVTGQNIDAARVAGINPEQEFMVAFAISGALAGLAGFIEVNGLQHLLLDNFDANVGSYGIGIAIMGNAHPLAIIFCSLLFGFLEVGGTLLSHTMGVPASVIDLMLGFVMILTLLSFFARRRFARYRAMKRAQRVSQVCGEV